MTTRLRLLVMIALTGLVALPAHAQQGATGLSGTGSLGGASPYTQKRPQAYTSFDNPYAPGGLYDPYKGSRPQVDHLSSGLPPRPKSARSGSSLNSGSGSFGGSSGFGGSKALSSLGGQCGGNKLGGGGTASSLAMSRLGASGSYSGISRCRGLASSGSSRSGGMGGMSGGSMNRSLSLGSMAGGMGSGQGMNSMGLQGQAANMGQQRMQRLQQGPQ